MNGTRVREVGEHEREWRKTPVRAVGGSNSTHDSDTSPGLTVHPVLLMARGLVTRLRRVHLPLSHVVQLSSLFTLHSVLSHCSFTSCSCEEAKSEHMER